MRSPITSNHFTDDGKPAGGSTYGRGFCISWQNGPLVENGERMEPNGAFVEDVIAAAADRIRHYQNETPFWCEENRDALNHLEIALQHLDARTKRRQTAGTEGAHQGK